MRFKNLGYAFLTSALGEGEGSASRSGRFAPGKEPLVSIGYKCGWASQPVLTQW